MPLSRQLEPEWMDEPGVPAGELLAALGYIRRVNRWLGYTRATRERVRPWLAGDGGVTVLDVATGSGDVPEDLIRAFGDRVRVVGLDLHPVTISEARRRVPCCPFVRGDATRLPFVDGAFDYVMASMFVHHLPEAMIVEVMREMWRVSRKGVLVADLLRNRRALFWIYLLTVGTSAMIQHDARSSVRAALTAEEALQLAGRAGWQSTDLRLHFGHRFTLVAVKPASGESAV